MKNLSLIFSLAQAPTRCILLLTTISLIGCASTDYQPVESSGPLVGQGQWGTRKVVNGVDIWTSGAPPRKYRVLGVINDTRDAGPVPMAGYYSGIAAKVRIRRGCRNRSL
jgi:hypothetical protein